VTVTATFRKVGGPPACSFGVVLRDQGPAPRDGVVQGGRYYVLAAGDRGEVGIWRRENTEWVDLVPWTPSAVVRPGVGPNRVEAQASGSHLTLRVNGVVVAEADDGALVAGKVGLYAGGDGNEVVVDHFTVTGD
jgi:hypothetical protein